MNDVNRLLNLKTNDTYITNVEEFKENIENIVEIDNNVKEYLNTLRDYLVSSQYSNRQIVIDIIDNVISKNMIEGDVYERGL